jgi:TPR repeat protein
MKAIHYFDPAANQGFAEAQYDLGICLLTCLTPNHNLEDAFRNLKFSAENGNADGEFAITCTAEHGIGAFCSVDLITAAQYYERCSNLSPAASTCFGWCLQSGRGIPVEITVAAEFFKRAADLDDVDGVNSFGCCLEQGQGVDPDIDEAASYYRRATSHFHPDGMYNFGRCLREGNTSEKSSSSCKILSFSLQKKTVLVFVLNVGLVFIKISFLQRNIINVRYNRVIQMVQIIFDFALNTGVE